MPGPNLLLITMDALRQDAVGAYGRPEAGTPQIDALAARGLRFTRAYCTQPLCMPSRASVLTGRYPRAHGVWDNGVNLPAAEISLFEVLRQAGVQTASFGKLHFQAFKAGFYPTYADQPENPEQRVPYRGFERVAIADNTPFGPYATWVRESFPQYEKAIANPFFDCPPGTALAWTSTLPAAATKTDWIYQQARSYFAGLDRERPFAAWVSFVDPHHPYNPPEPFAGWHDRDDIPEPIEPNSDLRYLPAHYRQWREEMLGERFALGEEPQRRWAEIIRRYRGKVSHVDDRIGRLLGELEAQGLLEETLVIVTADHGTPLCDFGLVQVGPYSFEGNIKVPLVCHWPGQRQGGEVSDALISLVDLLPTYFHLAGLPLPVGVQGRSFAPLLTGADYVARSCVLVEQRWGQEPDGFKTLVTPDWKLSLYVNGVEGELYDLVNDPGERRNRFDEPEYRAIQQELTAQMLYELMRREDPLPLRTGEW